ncbi:MAG TPA: hypothetical protein PKJ42_02245 [Candidatus Goldiibacteriota bacterium]|nr:hypothetical protein [Candidatus Goldiibacteriota bacterium]
MQENKKTKEPLEFIEALSYPAKKHRPLGKWPLSVPKDPIITDFSPIPGKKPLPKNFSYSLLFTAFDVRDYGGEIKQFMKIFQNLNVKRVYIESYRDGYSADPALLKQVKKELEKEGYAVSGCVTTTHLSDLAKYNEGPSAASCYTDKNALKNLKKIFETTASIFNEIIIDDWFFTVCRCPACTKAKGAKTWAEYRCRAIADAAKKYVIEPSKKVNSKVKLILKVPNWYQDFHKNGYDLERLVPLFDEIAVGTESRDPKTTRFMPVHGSMLFTYIKQLAPEKVKKAWFDVYMCDEKIYVEQAYQSLLGGADEIILFCAGIMGQKTIRPLVTALIEHTEKIDRLSGFSKIFTVPVLRAANTEGEDYLHQYLLMAGLPVYLTPVETKYREKLVVLTEQSAAEQDRPALFNRLIKLKKDILMTTGFAQSIKKYFGVKEVKEEVRVDRIKYAGRTQHIDEELYLKLEVTDGKHLALLNDAYPYLSFMKVKDSKVYVASIPVSAGAIKNILGQEEPDDYRFMFKYPWFTEPLKSIVKPYANVLLYNGLKTLYKYEI